MSQQGMKFDHGKTRYDLVPAKAFEQIAIVLTAGAAKYDDENWKLVPEGRKRYLAAAFRHIQAYRLGEVYDEGEGGTGTHHLANAITDLMFIVEKDLNGWEDIPAPPKNKPEEVKPWYPDDRPWIEFNHLTDTPPDGDKFVEVLKNWERTGEKYTQSSERAYSFFWDETTVAYLEV